MKIIPIGSNQIELHTEGKVILFSYETPVAAKVAGKCYRTDRRWSTTTSRHIGKWLGGISAETKPQEFFDSFS